MSISNYTELQTAVENWLKNTGISSRVTEFISLAESKINRKLRGLQQQTQLESSYSGSSRTVSYPTGFLEMLDVHAKPASQSDYYYEPVQFIPADRIWEKYYSTSGWPRWYTARENIEFNVAPDVTYTIKYHYLKKWDIENDSTNWLLTNYPDVYLYGALAEAEPYLWNDERIAIWKSLFIEAVDEVNNLENRTRDDGELSTSELGAMTIGPNSYDITRDY